MSLSRPVLLSCLLLLLVAPSVGATDDWWNAPGRFVASIREVDVDGVPHLVLDNGLVRRTLRLAPAAATVGLDDLMTDRALLRAVTPAARLTIDGATHAVGGLVGQPLRAYLDPRWLDAMTADPAAFVYRDHVEGPIAPRLAWARARPSEGRPWPPPGREVALRFETPPGALDGVEVTVHHAVYDGLPLLAKWITVRNGSGRVLRLDAYASELLDVVEAESHVEPPARWRLPDLHVETDYAFGGMSPVSAEQGARWVSDPDFLSQVNYARETPARLVSGPALGPAIDLAPGETFTSHRTWLLVHDGGDRERRGLARRRMYRTIAPWVTENPLILHVRQSDEESVRRAIDQAAEVGFEMVILTFGSGFDIEDERPESLARWKALADHAHARGVELGGYSLLSSRRISDADDVVGEPRFGHAPCLESAWGQDYFRKLYAFFEATGFDLLEHDGSYPGDACASSEHPGHRDRDDSVWRQRQRIRDFYAWCLARGVSLNVPDWYLLDGSTKVGMGYRETNWSLPREQQLIVGRQNIFDGTWDKTPSMGWMFVPLVEYHGGGAAATLEPLSEHLDAYAGHLANNLGAGVQACWRGPRLYDTPATREVVTAWVDWYKAWRRLLEADVVHVRRPDGRDVDGLLHVDPLAEGARALLVLHNPTDASVRRVLPVDLTYAGLGGPAEPVSVRVGGVTRRHGARVPVLPLDDPGTVGARDDRGRLLLPIELEPGGFGWWVLAPGG